MSGCQRLRGSRLHGIALFIFDYCVTFSREFEFIWSRGWPTISILCMATRYSALAYHALLLYLNISRKASSVYPRTMRISILICRYLQRCV
ncbi:hypothetical protein BC629DRAFT_36826 [Irpex lacteus]|nr:hypothetical protein BC629DRAFT_36826 [Irpex lacteus]